MLTNIGLPLIATLAAGLQQALPITRVLPTRLFGGLLSLSRPDGHGRLAQPMIGMNEPPLTSRPLRDLNFQSSGCARRVAVHATRSSGSTNNNDDQPQSLDYVSARKALFTLLAATADRHSQRKVVSPYTKISGKFSLRDTVKLKTLLQQQLKMDIDQQRLLGMKMGDVIMSAALLAQSRVTHFLKEVLRVSDIKALPWDRSLHELGVGPAKIKTVLRMLYEQHGIALPYEAFLQIDEMTLIELFERIKAQTVSVTTQLLEDHFDMQLITSRSKFKSLGVNKEKLVGVLADAYRKYGATISYEAFDEMTMNGKSIHPFVDALAARIGALDSIKSSLEVLYSWGDISDKPARLFDENGKLAPLRDDLLLSSLGVVNPNLMTSLYDLLFLDTELELLRPVDSKVSRPSRLQFGALTRVGEVVDTLIDYQRGFGSSSIH